MVHRCKTKIRYRRWDVGRPKHHYLQVAYCGNRLMEAKLKPYLGSGESEVVSYVRK